MRIPRDFQDEHVPSYHKRHAGSHHRYGGNIAVYRYRPRCSCGWTTDRKNLDREEARQVYRAHLEREYLDR